MRFADRRKQDEPVDETRQSMCGIAGYVSPERLGEDVLLRMTRLLVHRGPDAEGYYFDGPVSLGHRRLSIIDLAGSPQPMTTRDGALTVVFNGEIYNYRQLREELSKLGCHFQTQGDTEVLLHAYRRFGFLMLDRIEGMFAFALWDREAGRLFVARDPFGVKPLHYFWDGKTFVFASELKAVRAHPAVSAELDLDALGLYVECQYIPSPKTVYRDVRKLGAAQALVVEGGKLRLWDYWCPDYSNKFAVDEEEAIRSTEAELRRSVESMLVADVPLGCFLSGGIDSSLVSALAVDLAKRPIDTFHLGFKGETPSNEHVEAAAVAKHIGSTHHALLLEPRDLLSGFENWIDVFDEPFGDPAALPTMLLSQLARKDVTVVLTGEGADEILAGYDNYQKRAAEERISAVLGSRYSPLRYLVRFLPPVIRKDRIIRPIGEPLARRYATIPNIFDQALLPSLFTPQFLAAKDTTIVDYAERLFTECNSPHYIERIMHVDARLWLVDDLLTKVDRATMSTSLEARVPYLDRRFVEHCARLPPGWKRHGEVGKYLLKKIAERYLPRDLVHRRKQGFTLPLSEWFTGALRKESESALSGFAKRGLIRPEHLRNLLPGRRRGSRNRTGKLWTLLILEKWFRRYAPEFKLS
jgi:asparagine synthase (glutamine-hydrolysing)